MEMIIILRGYVCNGVKKKSCTTIMYISATPSSFTTAVSPTCDLLPTFTQQNYYSKVTFVVLYDSNGIT